MSAGSIGTLKAMLTLDTSQWAAGFATAQKTASGFVAGMGTKLIGIVGGIGKSVALAGLSAVTAGFSFHEMMESLGNVGALAGTARKLGITVEELQRLQFAASKSGIDLETLANGLLLMGKNIGSGGKSLDKRFMDVADAFTQIKDAGERAVFAREVFGKGGFDFINLLAKGSNGIRQSADAIDKFGVAIKDVDAAKAKEALIALKELKEVMGAYKDKLVLEVAPALTEFFSTQLELVSKLTEAWRQLGVVASAVKNVLASSFAISGVGASLAGGKGIAQFGTPDEKKSSVIGGIAGIAQSLASARSIGFASGAAEKGTVEAGRLIQGARNHPLAAPLKEAVDKLDAIKRNTDPRRAPPTGGVKKAQLR